MDNSIKAWIVDWFVNNTRIKRDEILNSENVNYLEKSWVDSLKFITFVSDIEESFAIRLSNDEFQDRSFSTIEGLSRIIEKRMKE